MRGWGNLYDNSYFMALWLFGLGYGGLANETKKSARIEKLEHEIENGNLQAMSELGRLLTFHGLPFPPRGFAKPGVAMLNPKVLGENMIAALREFWPERKLTDGSGKCKYSIG